MSALSPTTPTRPSNRQSVDGHTGSAKRVSPRTSLHSPYSARFTRSLSGRQHNTDAIDSPDADDPHQNLSLLSIHTPPSAERNSLPRYQRRSSSQSRERPSVTAVHTTYADETRIITRNMEMMSLEERMLWEYLVRRTVCLLYSMLNLGRGPIRTRMSRVPTVPRTRIVLEVLYRLLLFIAPQRSHILLPLLRCPHIALHILLAVKSAALSLHLQS